MTSANAWQRYLAAAQRLHDVRRSIAAIGAKPNPTQDELESLSDLLLEHGEAEQAVIDTSSIGRDGVADLTAP